MPVHEFQLRIGAKRKLTSDVTEFVLTTTDDRPLPGATPGSHITVATPSGARRRYSLTRAGENPLEYSIAVKREAAGRGGSVSLIDETRVDQEILVQAPENDFPLLECDDYLFVAAGIGITPILSMIRALRAQAKGNYKLIYLTRDAEHATFQRELADEKQPGEVTIHHDNGDARKAYDLWPELEEPDGRHIYYCGPAPLMEEIGDMTGHWPTEQLHCESFAPVVQAVRETDHAFSVICQRSGIKVEVGADESALAAIRNAGVAVASSCESGTCGSCKTTLLKGDVAHRDLVLTDSERSTHIMLCVSRAAAGEIVVDL